MDDGRVAGAMGLHLNRAPVPCEEAAGVLRALATFFVALRGRAVRAPDAPVEERRMAGESAAILDVRAKIPKAALHDSNVLITGESGTGKEVVARAVHEASPRGSGPFLAVNCAAMPETLLESTLYGHEEGAFSGAVRRHIGKIEQAQGGTLFLDEIGDTTLNGQAKLLRFLEERVFERVGGEETLRADVRVVAATNCDLRAMVERGEFRADLYYRLAVVKIVVPPLAERREDIPAIVAEILRRLEVRQDRKLSISAEAVALLARRPWPGNIRELAHALEEAAVLHGPDLDATHFAGLPPESPGSAGTPKAAAPADVAPLQDLARPQGPEPKSAPTVAHPPLPPGLEPGSARGLVWQRACEVLRQTGYRICAAAKLIGWSRQWMRKYIDKFKLHDVLHFIRIRRPKAAET
ncbi:MAG: sigma-54-dependent Fis family transcriptional regulator [Planctomycetia bacterium]|nr:sigma-54-dependent Fis family transcriptional regulator [Planctomycetia bacterium]